MDMEKHEARTVELSGMVLRSTTWAIQKGFV